MPPWKEKLKFCISNCASQCLPIILFEPLSRKKKKVTITKPESQIKALQKAMQNGADVAFKPRSPAALPHNQRRTAERSGAGRRRDARGGVEKPGLFLNSEIKFRLCLFDASDGHKEA